MPILIASIASNHNLITATPKGVRALHIPAFSTIADPKNRPTDQALRSRIRSRFKASAAAPGSIFDLATSQPEQLHPPVADIYRFESGLADCLVTEQLVQKFGTSTASRAMVSSHEPVSQSWKCAKQASLSSAGLPSSPQQSQIVVSVTDKFGHQQAWFNEARSKKPQLFKANKALSDPTLEKGHCDFCQWKEYTANDNFGRYQILKLYMLTHSAKSCKPE